MSRYARKEIPMMYDSQGRRVEKRVLNAAGIRSFFF